MSHTDGRRRHLAPAPFTPPADVARALERAVTQAGEEFVASEWSFDGSTFLALVAHRTEPALGTTGTPPTGTPNTGTPNTGNPSSGGLGHGRDRLIFSSDRRTRWISEHDDAEQALGELEREGSLTRMEIEWLLTDALRFGRGEWDITPIDDLGWWCSRRSRIGVRKHFVVTADRTFTRLRDRCVDGARERLASA